MERESGQRRDEPIRLPTCFCLSAVSVLPRSFFVQPPFSCRSLSRFLRVTTTNNNADNCCSCSCCGLGQTSLSIGPPIALVASKFCDAAAECRTSQLHIQVAHTLFASRFHREHYNTATGEMHFVGCCGGCNTMPDFEFFSFVKHSHRKHPASVSNARCTFRFSFFRAKVIPPINRRKFPRLAAVRT